ncbi:MULTISPECIES: hypothetical protein [Photobacterium]|uniref:Uncharacterized protein n=2 Tax=Photobacterium TaxID=657 RepID=A0A1Y6L640_9GAMM|nr:MULTISPECIES: hypothetical protein [Photobacterium]SMY17998.1 hypothetical protein PAQU9191_03329 [Photobacterium aquimaris]SMY38213.1 hypothetical protein PAND9192_03502 [Photobacterium andalusiense]
MKKALKINNIYVNMETIVAFDLNYKIDGNRALYLLTNCTELPFLEIEVDDINFEKCSDYQAQKVSSTEFIRIKRELCVYMGITL